MCQVSTRSIAQVPIQVVPVGNIAAQHNIPPAALHSALQASGLTALDTCASDTSLSSTFVPRPLVARPSAARQLRPKSEEAISFHAPGSQAEDTHVAPSHSTGISSDVGSMVNRYVLSACKI